MGYDKNGRTVPSKRFNERSANTAKDTGFKLKPRVPKENGSKSNTFAETNILDSNRKFSDLNKAILDKSTFVGIKNNVRILPILIVCALLIGSMKITFTLDSFGKQQSKVSVISYAEAEQKSQNTLPASKSQSEKSLNLAQAQPAKQNNDKPLDPVLFTRSEIELLQELAKRRKELDLREQTMVQREGLLTAAEDRIDKKIAELQQVKSNIEILIEKYDKQEEQKFSGLVSIYEKMKPKDAARIFDELSMEILLEVFDRMKASKSAPILANMRPNQAKELSSRIADRREMPKLK